MAWKFDGSSAVNVQITDDAVLSLPSGGPWTFGFWVKLDSNLGTIHRHIFGWGSYAATPSITIYFEGEDDTSNPNKLGWRLIDDGGTGDWRNGASTSGTNRDWMHFLWQYDGTNHKGFIDNVEDVTKAKTFVGFDIAAPFWFGSTVGPCMVTPSP